VSVFDVEDLTVRYAISRDRRAVDGVSFAIGDGEIVGVSGPSGCGKSTMALAIMGLLPSDVDVSGSIRLRGRDLRACSERQLAAVRGAGIGIIFQESALALNPLLTVGAQISEIVRAHDTCDRDTARQPEGRRRAMVGQRRRSGRSASMSDLRPIALAALLMLEHVADNAAPQHAPELVPQERVLADHGSV